MRKRRNKNSLIKIHNSYIIISLGFILTGNYLNLIAFTTLILFHELGHYLTAYSLKINVSNITIYPFGGITKLNTKINTEIEKELLIALSGIIFQYIFYLFICYLNKISLIRDYTLNIYTIYNNETIFFNLLPIYPLDGSKILNLLLIIYIPYKVSNLIIIIMILILKTYNLNYSNIIIYFILFTYLIKFYQKRKYIYQKFLLERYLYDFSFKKTKIINNYQHMYKDKKHLIFKNGKLYKEKTILNKIFK